jgi:isopenicillin N synthase-like dioxygenase
MSIVTLLKEATMELDIISYHDLISPASLSTLQRLESALLTKGIVGIRDVPGFLEKSQAFIKAARNFSSLKDSIKKQYLPDRDKGDITGYELGAERFKDQNGSWQTDDKKSSFYAFVSSDVQNKWPNELDLRTPYLDLADLIFNTGKKILNFIKLNHEIGLHHEGLIGVGRMLHYHKNSDTFNANPHWCGAHFDHGVFTGLMPAYYFQNGEEVDEPHEAGLYIQPTGSAHFEKMHATDKSVLLFQVGEFGQLASHDAIKATKHLVKKAYNNIERFTFVVFYSASDDAYIHSQSQLTKDERYRKNQSQDGSISYGKWAEASFERYRA